MNAALDLTADTARIYIDEQPEPAARHVRPTASHVLVRRAPRATKTAGGIEIPGTAEHESLEATVLAVGPGTRCADGTTRPVEVQPGDTVLLGRFDFQARMGDSDAELFCHEAELLAVVRDGRLVMLQDNVLIRMTPALEAKSPGGIIIPQTAKKDSLSVVHAEVHAVGSGYWRRLGRSEMRTARCWLPGRAEVFVPTSVVAGEKVLVRQHAGQAYDIDLHVPRHNKAEVFREVPGVAEERVIGGWRIVREEEILAVVEA